MPTMHRRVRFNKLEFLFRRKCLTRKALTRLSRALPGSGTRRASSEVRRTTNEPCERKRTVPGTQCDFFETRDRTLRIGSPAATSGGPSCNERQEDLVVSRLAASDA